MKLQNDITDNFLDAEYQYLTESDSNASLDWLDAIPSSKEDRVLHELSVPLDGGTRSKDYSELNLEPLEFYYDRGIRR